MVKRCPTCQKIFTDENLSFCVDDGTPLVPIERDDEETIVSPSAGTPSSGDEPRPSYYQPPGSYVPPPGQRSGQKAWPWILGIVVFVILLIVGVGILGAVLLPKLLRASSENSNVNANVDSSQNSNANVNVSNRNTSPGENESVDETAQPPTDEAQVLAELTDLEHEWTVANINADKKKLDRILADDYVSTNADGALQGKAEYLKTIERDDTIQKWEFEDLQVSLKGDRASLSGILRLQVQGQEVAYRFTDKFVWRDGRWQAIGSEVTRIE